MLHSGGWPKCFSGPVAHRLHSEKLYVNHLFGDILIIIIKTLIINDRFMALILKQSLQVASRFRIKSELGNNGSKFNKKNDNSSLKSFFFKLHVYTSLSEFL